jgi:hypothetical protein
MLQYAKYNRKEFFDKEAYVTPALPGATQALAMTKCQPSFYYNSRDKNNFRN